MSQDKYFDKFPVIEYNGVKAIDITRRVAPLKSTVQNPNFIYPYSLESYERPDQFCERYYRDPYKSWQLFVLNGIIDAHNEWYLQPQELADRCVSKYGSLERAQDKVKFYRNNWSVGNDIDVSTFNAATATVKNYYTPVYAANQRISAYTRKRTDWSVNTNKIVKYTVANNDFTFDEIVDIVYGVGHTGTAQVFVTSETNSLYVQHTSGTTLPSDVAIITGGSYIVGRESGTNTAFTAASLEIQNLEDEEEVLWAPVTYYDFEVETNEYNKSIIVLDNRYSQKMVDELKTLMKE